MRAYVPEDYFQIMDWWVKRTEGEPIEAQYLSDIGFIVDGLAAVFLFTTNSKVAYIDFLISNPEAPHQDSQMALDTVVQACISRAKKEGFRVLLGSTSRAYVCNRAVKNGFQADEGYWHLAIAL